LIHEPLCHTGGSGCFLRRAGSFCQLQEPLDLPDNIFHRVVGLLFAHGFSVSQVHPECKVYLA
jgi:hypothetical protein